MVAASAGNHAQGVALAAKLLGIKSTIVVPEYAPLTKIIATKGFGAEVILHGSSFDEAMDHSFQLRDEKGFTHIHAFDDESDHRRTGNDRFGDCRDLPQTSVIVVPIGGGGVISGIAIAAKESVAGSKNYRRAVGKCFDDQKISVGRKTRQSRKRRNDCRRHRGQMSGQNDSADYQGFR